MEWKWNSSISRMSKFQRGCRRFKNSRKLAPNGTLTLWNLHSGLWRPLPAGECGPMLLFSLMPSLDYLSKIFCSKIFSEPIYFPLTENNHQLKLEENPFPPKSLVQGNEIESHHRWAVSLKQWSSYGDLGIWLLSGERCSFQFARGVLKLGTDVWETGLGKLVCESIQKNPRVVKMKSSVLGSTLSKPVWFGLFFLAGVIKY